MRIRSGLLPSATLVLAFTSSAYSQDVTVVVDVAKEPRPISKYLYGKNNSASQNVDKPTSEADWTRIRESGVTILRENSGNNSTKYNWRRRLGSSPDWYNEVVQDNWDYEVKSIQEKLPGMQAMYGFQLIGWAAKTPAHNWDAWSWNVAHGNKWLNPHQNMTGTGAILNDSLLANGGTPGKAKRDGDIESYLERWPVDSSLGILDHWFGPGGLGLDKNRLQYWAMDNEPDIWSSTHDDVVKVQPDAETFLKVWFEAASKARAKFPGIKIVGPVACNEWFWYQWPGGGTKVDGKTLPWLEYFIKRVAEEQKRTGLRLLDVFSIHFYPGNRPTADILQTHRIYFDTSYAFPGASGVKLVNGGWDAALDREFVLLRARQWMDKYMGPGHGIEVGVTETGLDTEDPNINAVWYASTLGEFMKNDVELFTPWSWKKGMWEVLHLFGRHAAANYLPSTSTNDSLVSAYVTVNARKDTMTAFLVNRDTSSARSVSFALKNVTAKGSTATTRMLSGLPSDKETYNSHASNALKTGTATVAQGKLQIALPALSVTAVTIPLQATTGVSRRSANQVSMDRKDLQPRYSLDPVPGLRGSVDASGRMLVPTKGR